MPNLVKVVFDIPVDDSFDYISDNKKAKIEINNTIKTVEKILEGGI